MSEISVTAVHLIQTRSSELPAALMLLMVSVRRGAGETHVISFV